MLHFYKSVISPVLEYACPVWHNSLTTEQSDRIESILQKRTFKVISGSNNNDYEQLCILYNIPSLFKRRVILCKQFFQQSVLNPSGCLHYLLPTQRDTNI
jgi:hypothetical protein